MTPDDYSDIPAADLAIAPSIGVKNMAEYIRGYRWMRAIIAHHVAFEKYGDCGPSQLYLRDEQDRQPPGPEALTWATRAVGWQPCEWPLSDQGGFWC